MDRLMRELVNETKEEDIADRYRPIVDIIGVDAFVELSIYACGDELYFPEAGEHRGTGQEPAGQKGIQWLQSEGACGEVQPHHRTDPQHPEGRANDRTDEHF